MYRFLPVVFGAFILGIAFRSFYEFGWSFIFLFGMLALGVLFISRQKPFVVFAIFAIGVGRMHIAVPSTNVDISTQEKIVFEGVVIKEPDVRETYINVIVARSDTRQKVLVRITPYEQVHYKDTVKVNGFLEVPENFESENGRVFNYRAYLAKDDIHTIVPFPEFEVLTSRDTPTGLLLELKRAYLESLKSILPEPSAALAGGITVGERRSLGDDLTQDFIKKQVASFIMKLLVTGGLGFIGSNFILKILNEYKDFSIINIDAEFFGSNKKNLEQGISCQKS